MDVLSKFSNNFIHKKIKVCYDLLSLVFVDEQLKLIFYTISVTVKNCISYKRYGQITVTLASDSVKMKLKVAHTMHKLKHK